MCVCVYCLSVCLRSVCLQAPALSLSLEDWHLLIPSRARFEARLRVKSTTQMQLQQAAESQIISRVLKIGASRPVLLFLLPSSVSPCLSLATHTLTHSLIIHSLMQYDHLPLPLRVA